MANKTDDSDSRSLNLEDLDQIVGGATPTHAQYDTVKQSLLTEINNTDINTAVAAAVTSITNSQGSAASITAAITSIETHAATDHVSEVAALAALDAATYGGANVNGNDAVAAELTKVLTNGTGEADIAHDMALGNINPVTMINELDQAIQILAMGSASGHTALGMTSSAAVDWVEANLVNAASAEAAADNAAAAMVPVPAPMVESGGTINNSPQAQAYNTEYQADVSEAQNATSFQNFLNVQHQGEVAEGNAIIAVEAALGSNLATIQADAALLNGLTGTALQNEISTAEHVTSLPNDVTLVALDLFSSGNAGVQQLLSADYTSHSLETSLAGVVATGGITGNLAVETLNLIVMDLAQNSVNANTEPAMEQGFAVATADVLLATDATNLAATDTAAANAQAAYNPGSAIIATDAHQAQLATSLATLINTTYGGEVALANEITVLENQLGSYAATILADATTLTAGNTTLAEQYISAIETKAAEAEAAALPGSTQSVFSADAALALLAIYSNGNPTVLGEIEARLVSGSAEQDLANLVTLGAMPATEAVATLTTLVDTLAANSPNNSVTLTGSDNQSVTLDRTSAEDWALGQLAKYALPMLDNLATAEGNFAEAVATFNTSTLPTEAKALAIALAEAPNILSLISLLEGADAAEVVTGLGIDTAWASSAASADAAAAIAAGTTQYDGMNVVSAAAQQQAGTIDVIAGERELANLTLAQEVMQGYLTNVWNQNISAGQQSDAAIVEADAQSFYLNFAVPAAEFGYGVASDALDEWGITAVYQSEQAFANDPDLQNFVDLALNSGMIFKGPFPQALNIADFGLQAMAALMQEGAVSDVIGTEAAGDLATSFQVLHDAISGGMNMFSNWVLAYGQTGVQLTDDTITVAENSFTLANDLYHGNTGALAGDSLTLFENMGKGLLDFAEADYGMQRFFVPLQDVIPLATDLAQQLIGMESDFMSNSDFASVADAVGNEAKSLATAINNLLPSSTDADLTEAFNAIEGGLSEAASKAESWADDVGGFFSSLLP